MALRPELFSRVVGMTSSASLAPLMRAGPGASIPERLRADLAEQTILDGPGDLNFRQITAGRDAAQCIRELIRAQPVATDFGVDVFGGPNVSLGVVGFQQDFLEASVKAVTVLASDGGPFGDREINGVLRLATSATPAGQLLRQLTLDPTRDPTPLDPPRDGVPGVPGVSEELFVEAERLRQRGCAGAVVRAMARLGETMRNWTPSYLVDAIEALQPPDGCSGEVMLISGHGFGNAAGRSVAFTALRGGVVVTPAGNIRDWTDRRIRLEVPDGAIRGPVGIIVFPAGGGMTPAQAGTAAMAEIQACFGPAPMARMEETLNQFQIAPIFPPQAQANGLNLFTGGPPVIESFFFTPPGPLWPGRGVRLSWTVVGADRITIVARDVDGSAPQELPAIPGPLEKDSGSISVNVPGNRPWQGQYLLRAFNRCTGDDRPVEAVVNLEMVIRRGLALGGDGSRGDFQAGALLYLYEHEYRPNAISATSVGAINAIELAMGDNAAGSAAARLVDTWRALNDESDMWEDEPWLARLRPDLRGFRGLKTQMNPSVVTTFMESIV
jgi:hypothetical protein